LKKQASKIYDFLQRMLYRNNGLPEQGGPSSMKDRDTMAGPKMLNLMILGARRSATSSLLYYLQEHPEIQFLSNEDFNPIGGVNVSFPYNNPFTAITGRDAIMDKYKSVLPKQMKHVKYIAFRAVFSIYFPHVLFNLAEHVPDLKILMSLRNPADATYSVFCRRLEDDPSLSFEKELKMSDSGFVFHKPSDVPNFISRGIYYPGIHMIYQLFPPQQIHIVSFEDLTKRTKETMQGILRFLELDEKFRFKRLSQIKGASKKPGPMAPETRQRLDEFFDPYNRKLFDLLGLPGDKWRNKR
jgi:hypothetical protein